MSADYPAAEEHFVPRYYLFNSNAQVAIVIHKTGGDATPAAIYNTFIASGAGGVPGRSVHYGVGQDGSIWQYAPEALGAGGNGGVEPGYDPFWAPYVQQYGNLNLCTFSIEHCDPAPDNSTPLTRAQQEASFRLVAHLVQRYAIPLSHIKGHFSIDPQSRARCPGNYPWQELFTYLSEATGQGGTSAVQPYLPASHDFSWWFNEQDADHWLCKKTTCVVHGAIRATYAQFSTDGQTLPILGLPVTNEITVPLASPAGSSVIYQVFERGALCFDPTHTHGSQPGLGDTYLLHLTDPDLLANIPGLVLPAAPPVVSIPDAVKADAAAVLAAAQKLAHDSGLD